MGDTFLARSSRRRTHRLASTGKSRQPQHLRSPIRPRALRFEHLEDRLALSAASPVLVAISYSLEELELTGGMAVIASVSGQEFLGPGDSWISPTLEWIQSPSMGVLDGFTSATAQVHRTESQVAVSLEQHIEMSYDHAGSLPFFMSQGKNNLFLEFYILGDVGTPYTISAQGTALVYENTGISLTHKSIGHQYPGWWLDHGLKSYEQPPIHRLSTGPAFSLDGALYSSAKLAFESGSTHLYGDTGPNKPPYHVDGVLQYASQVVVTNLSPLPDIVATSVSWNTDDSRIDYSYEVNDADLPKATSGALYWSSDATFDESDTPASEPFVIDVQQTTSPFSGSVPNADLTLPPSGTSYLLLVVDSENLIVESDEPNPGDFGANNVVADNWPTVTIARAAGQPERTSDAGVRFAVEFSKPVYGFGAEGVILGGTAAGDLAATVTGNGAEYEVTVHGMTGTGTVLVSVPDGAASDAAGKPNWTSGQQDGWVIFLANPWQNYPQAYDVADNGHVGPRDALMVINWLNTYGPGPLPPEPPGRPMYVDVDGNGVAAPLDALLVINYINYQADTMGEGESATGSPDLNVLFALDTHRGGPVTPIRLDGTPPPLAEAAERPRDDQARSRQVRQVWDDLDETLFRAEGDESEEAAFDPALLELDEILPDLATELLRSWG